MNGFPDEKAIYMNLDKETVELIAKAAADEAVKGLRTEIITDIRSEIESNFKAHFGSMSSFDHATQHTRIDKLLGSLDKLSDNFWGQMVAGIVKWSLAIFVAHYFLTNNKLL